MSVIHAHDYSLYITFIVVFQKTKMRYRKMLATYLYCSEVIEFPEY